MSTATDSAEPCAIRAWADMRMVFVELTDGRILGFPADRYRILSAVSEEELCPSGKAA